MTPAQKTEYLALARKHFDADMLIQGSYGEGYGPEFRGCSVGCFVHDIRPELSGGEIQGLGGLHKIVADHFGAPEWLLHLQDDIFEGLPVPEHRNWHVKLAETIARLPDDHDWQRAHHRVHASILCVAIKSAGESAEVVQRVIDLHERASRGEDVRESEWSAAWSAARSAARSAEWSAERYTAWYAAQSDAPSAERSAQCVAGISAQSAAQSATQSATRETSAKDAWDVAWYAAFIELRDAVLAALPEPNPGGTQP